MSPSMLRVPLPALISVSATPSTTMTKPSQVNTQLPSPPSPVSNGPSRQASPRHQTVQQHGQPDMFLQLLQGPVVSVQVGSDRNVTRYNLPAALFRYQSHLFRQEISHYIAVSAELPSNKKRKLSPDDQAFITRIKADSSESVTEISAGDDSQCTEGEAAIKLLGVDPFIFGLFLKFAYTGYYPAAVDVRPEATRPTVHLNKSTQPDTPYTPARASMPPPANINSQQAPPGELLPYLPVSASETSTLSLEESSRHVTIPPSVHAYILSVQLGAPAFLNQTISHIYYGIGKHFVLTPVLVHYIWSNTAPHPFFSPSPLRKLILDVMAVHWSSTTTHVVAKQPALHRLWNELLDLHRDLRHAFAMGLQGVRKVLPVQAYFVDTCVPMVSAESKSKESDVQSVNLGSTDGLSGARAAAVAAKAQEDKTDQKKV